MISGALSKSLLVVAGVVLLLGVGFVAGYNWCNSGKQGAIVESLDDDKRKVEKIREVIKYKDKKVIVYVDKIKTVTDPTGCADTPADPGISDSLLEAYRLTTGSEIN